MKRDMQKKCNNKSNLSTRYCRDLNRNLYMCEKRPTKETSIYGEKDVSKRPLKRDIYTWRERRVKKTLKKRHLYMERETCQKDP